nr:MAG TPA: hypothetical protein [Caudoviricetes sp.]
MRQWACTQASHRSPRVGKSTTQSVGRIIVILYRPQATSGRTITLWWRGRLGNGVVVSGGDCPAVEQETSRRQADAIGKPQHLGHHRRRSTRRFATDRPAYIVCDGQPPPFLASPRHSLGKLPDLFPQGTLPGVAGRQWPRRGFTRIAGCRQHPQLRGDTAGIRTTRTRIRRRPRPGPSTTTRHKTTPHQKVSSSKISGLRVQKIAGQKRFLNPPHHLATSVTANSGSATGGIPLGSAAAAAGGKAVGAVPAVAAAAQHHQGLAGVSAVGEGMRVLGSEVPRRVRRAAIAGAHITMGDAPLSNRLAPSLPTTGFVAFGGHGSALVPLMFLGVAAAPAPVGCRVWTPRFAADSPCARHGHHLL